MPFIEFILEVILLTIQSSVKSSVKSSVNTDYKILDHFTQHHKRVSGASGRVYGIC